MLGFASRSPTALIVVRGKMRSQHIKWIFFIAALLPAPAFAHSPGIEFFLLGIPFAAYSYLLSSLVFIFSAPLGHRARRFYFALAGFPFWLVIFIIPGLQIPVRGPYLYWWSIWLPTSLFIAVCIFLLVRAKNKSYVDSRHIKRRYIIVLISYGLLVSLGVFFAVIGNHDAGYLALIGLIIPGIPLSLPSVWIPGNNIVKIFGAGILGAAQWLLVVKLISSRGATKPCP